MFQISKSRFQISDCRFRIYGGAVKHASDRSRCTYALSFVLHAIISDSRLPSRLHARDTQNYILKAVRSWSFLCQRNLGPFSGPSHVWRSGSIPIYAETVRREKHSCDSTRDAGCAALLEDGDKLTKQSAVRPKPCNPPTGEPAVQHCHG